MASLRQAGAARPYAGIFVGGAAPVVLVADRGRLLPHPAPADGPVAAFTPFHNPDCEQARPLLIFNYGTRDSSLWCYSQRK
jgi:hypothetical protein